MRIAIEFAAAGLIVFSATGYAQDSVRAEQLKTQGIAAGNQKDWTRAVDLLQQAHSIAPGNPSILYSLGSVHEATGDKLQAIGWLRAFLATNPDPPIASRIGDEIVRLRSALRGDEDRIFNQAVQAAMQIDQSTAAGSAAFPLAMDGIANDEASVGNFDEANGTAIQGRLSDEDTAYFKDHVLTVRAHVAALEGDLDAAARLLPQIKDLQFAVGGVALVTYSNPASGPVYPSRNDYQRGSGGNGEAGFWSHIKREVTQTPCYRVDEALAKQVQARIQYDESPPPYHGWMGNDVSSRPEDQNTGSSCTRKTAVERWVSFAETICDRGAQCSVEGGVDKAASERDLAGTAFRLSGVGLDLGRKLLQFEVLDSQTSRTR